MQRVINIVDYDDGAIVGLNNLCEYRIDDADEIGLPGPPCIPGSPVEMNGDLQVAFVPNSAALQAGAGWMPDIDGWPPGNELATVGSNSGMYLLF